MNELLTQLPALSKPLLHARLSESQWKNVEYINSALNQEYECRKAMVLKRLDVTIQSFKWSDKAKVINILFLAQTIKIDSRFTYLGTDSLKNGRRFDLLLQILIKHWLLPAA